MDRNERIERALDVESGEYGYDWVGSPDYQDKIRDRVRELCREQNCFLDYRFCYTERTDEQLDVHQIGIGSPEDMLYDPGQPKLTRDWIHQNMNTESTAWEEALLWLSENQDE